MDFARVISLLSDYLEGRGHPFALIGGLSMAAYGMIRTTLDLDLVTVGKVQDDLVTFLEREGYETIHRSSGYSNHAHSDPELGRVDVVYVRGQTGDELFKGAHQVAGPDGTSIPVLRAEHIAAMKIFAMHNDPSRTFSELEDIRYLLSLPDIDREEIRGYFDQHGLGELLAKLE